MTNAVGYLRLSKAEMGHGIDVQHASLADFCERRGYSMTGWHIDDGVSGRSTRKRPGLAACIEMISGGAAQALVATRVDRLARSSLDFHRIVDEVTRARGTVLFSEQESFSLDTPEGKMLAGILASFAAFEADLISARTKAALAVVRRSGSRSGRPIGNPHFRRCPESVAVLIRELRAEGRSYAAIARELDSRGVPTVQGGSGWGHAAVRGVALRAD